MRLSSPQTIAVGAHEFEALVLPRGAPVPVRHNNLGEAVAMREALLGLGFAVDAISRERSRFRPRARYDLFVGARQNFARIAATLPPDCIIGLEVPNLASIERLGADGHARTCVEAARALGA